MTTWVCTCRDTTKPLAEWDKRGDEMFRAVYQDRAAGVQKKLHDAYPDLGVSSTLLALGHLPTLPLLFPP